MLIKIINPNTTVEMTASIGTCARAVASVGTVVVAATPTMGPTSIESHYDEALSVPGLLTEIRLGEQAGVDGYVIACFGDPGLDAAREVARGPVVGIAEAAMHTASFLGRSFSVVTTLSRTTGRAWDLAERYGMARFCRNVRAVDVPVLELDDPEVEEMIARECRAALEVDRCDVIVLGCAGMAALCHRLSVSLGIPVVDGVAAALRTVEGLVAMGLRTGATGEYAAPPVKEYRGSLQYFGGLRAATPRGVEPIGNSGSEIW